MKLADWRKSQEMTQEAVASELGIERLSIARYEAGRRLPAPAVMIELYRLSKGAVQPNDFYDLPTLASPALDEAA